MSETYYGYTLYRPTYDNELLFVVCFETQYKSRKSVIDNLDRCIEEQTGIKGYSIHGSYSKEGECPTHYPVIHKASVECNIDEVIELNEGRADCVEVIDATVYVKPKQTERDTFINRLSREYGVKKEIMKSIVECFCGVHMITPEHDMQGFVEYFEQFINRTSQGCKS